MPKIDCYWLIRHNACLKAQSEFEDIFGSRTVDFVKLINMMKRKKSNIYLEWALWLMPRVMTKSQLNSYAFYLLNKVLPLAKKVFKIEEDEKMLKDGVTLMGKLKSKTRTKPLSNKNYHLLNDLRNRSLEFYLKAQLSDSMNALYSIVTFFQEYKMFSEVINISEAIEYLVIVFSRNKRGCITRKEERSVSLQVINVGVKILTS